MQEKEKALKPLKFQGLLGAASQIRTGDLILTNFECKLLMECLLMPADALQAVEIQHFSQSAAIPKLYQSERPNCWL